MIYLRQAGIALLIAMAAAPTATGAQQPVRRAQAPHEADRYLPAPRVPGRPRVVVFWNRTFSDDLATEYEEVTRFSSDSESSGSERERSYRDSREKDVSSRSSNEGEIRSGVRRNDTAKRSGLSERGDWQLETAFNNDLVGAGVNLIDRSAIVRLAGRDSTEALPNQQTIETRALVGHADVLVEILQSEDADAPAGMSFRVTAKQIASGRLLAQFVTNASPPQGRPRWVAGPSGFVRETLPPASLNQVAQQLANETLLALSHGLARR